MPPLAYFLAGFIVVGILVVCGALFVLLREIAPEFPEED